MINVNDLLGEPNASFLVDTSFVDTSFDQPRTEQTVPTSIAMETQAIDKSGTGDSWGDWFKTVANSSFQYALAKDAAVTRAELSRPPAMQYGTAAQVPAQRRDNTLLLILLGVGAVVVLNK